MNRPVAFGLRIYRMLAAAFPYEFQCAYCDELLLTTEDAIEDIWRRHGMFGLARLLLDIAIRVPLEHLAELRQDVRYGFRALRASPGFTAVALISLTLGIGVASSAFSEMNGFILRDVPAVSSPDELVTLHTTVPYPSYQLYRQRTDLFSASFAYLAPVPFGVAFGGHTERVWGHIVTPSYFGTLGVRPFMGRFFPGDERSGGTSVVVSYRFWQIEMGGGPAAIGGRLRINGQTCTVIGVGPKEFLGASPMVYQADLWLPVTADPRVAPELRERILESHAPAQFHMVARLRPGVPVERAEAALDTIARQIDRSYGEDDPLRKGRRVKLLSGGKMLPTSKEQMPFFTGFFSLLGGMVLLIACSNVANMTLARAADRRKEIAVRLAIGAGRARLVRQLMTESMMVALAAGGLGFLMAVALMHLASQERMPFPMPITPQLEPDGRCLLFTFVLTVFTGLAFGLAPALRATRTDLTPSLKEGAVPFSRYRRWNSRNVLVLAQITASLMLLLITGFLVIGHARMSGLDVGFDARNLYLMALDPVRDGFSGDQAADRFDRIVKRLERVPGFTAVTLTSHSPMEAIGYPAVSLAPVESGPGGARPLYSARRFIVGSSYFETVGIRLLSGREFQKQDETRELRPVVLSETLAHAMFGADVPLGRRIEMSGEQTPSFAIGFGGKPAAGRKGIPDAQTFEVVGVAANVRDGLDPVQKQPWPAIYMSFRPGDFAQPRLHGLTLMVRTRPGVDAFGTMRREIADVDGSLTPFQARTMTEQVEGLMFAVRVAATTYGAIGLFGLILTAVGLAGVTAYSVARRRREIGIRMALGARRADVLKLVMLEGAVLVGIGTLLGIAGARAGMRALSGFMAEVARVAGSSTSDPMLLVGAPMLLAAMALAACYLPARKSTRIDPAVTLRQE